MKNFIIPVAILLIITLAIVIHTIALNNVMDDFIELADKAYDAARNDRFDESSGYAGEILAKLEQYQLYLCGTMDFGLISECEVLADRIRVCLEKDSKYNLLMDIAQLRRIFKTMKTSENISFDNLF